ncbi:hypothetical protein HAX54_027023 [Datura stramonium]|uniref:Uncharacterized protein n=1 Tax=Datura stramonium TaxID=4076 RepID=A0ABS8V3F5_DATST|nr:hypothetical protein [Datura stramonium]
MAGSQMSYENTPECRRDNTVKDQKVDAENQPIVDNEEELVASGGTGIGEEALRVKPLRQGTEISRTAPRQDCQ